LPDAPDVTVNHGVLLLTAVQLQPACAVTLTEPVVVAATADRLVGEIEYEQGAADCVTVNVCPPIVTVPVRGDVTGLGCAWKSTASVPLPDAGVTVSQLALLLVAFHAQPAAVLSVVDPVPPPAATVWLVGDSE
jgi:hypothetical protein